MADPRIAEIRAQLAAATKGPWQWFGNLATRTIYLATTHSGRRFVMQFDRWGMRGAQPQFQVDSAMCDLDELVSTGHVEVKHDKEILAFTHPDAKLIASAPSSIEYLLERNDALEGELDALRAQLERLTGAVKWALGEEGEFSATPDELLTVLRAGKESLRVRGSARFVYPLYWWRSELRQRAFEPPSPTPVKASVADGGDVSTAP